MKSYHRTAATSYLAETVIHIIERKYNIRAKIVKSISDGYNYDFITSFYKVEYPTPIQRIVSVPEVDLGPARTADFLRIFHEKYIEDYPEDFL